MRQFYVGTLSLGFPPRVADLRVQASLEQRQQFQQLFFPDGIAFDGKRFGGTRVTAPAFSYLQPIVDGNERLVDQTKGWEPIDQTAAQIEPLHVVGSELTSRDRE